MVQRLVVFVAATSGDGEAPDNMKVGLFILSLVFRCTVRIWVRSGILDVPSAQSASCRCAGGHALCRVWLGRLEVCLRCVLVAPIAITEQMPLQLPKVQRSRAQAQRPTATGATALRPWRPCAPHWPPRTCWRALQLGAMPFVERGLGDDQSPRGMEGARARSSPFSSPLSAAAGTQAICTRGCRACGPSCCATSHFLPAQSWMTHRS